MQTIEESASILAELHGIPTTKSNYSFGSLVFQEGGKSGKSEYPEQAKSQNKHKQTQPTHDPRLESNSASHSGGK